MKEYIGKMVFQQCLSLSQPYPATMQAKRCFNNGFPNFGLTQQHAGRRVFQQWLS
jgi:hypothetical protein